MSSRRGSRKRQLQQVTKRIKGTMWTAIVIAVVYAMALATSTVWGSLAPQWLQVMLEQRDRFLTLGAAIFGVLDSGTEPCHAESVLGDGNCRRPHCICRSAQLIQFNHLGSGRRNLAGDVPRVFALNNYLANAQAMGVGRLARHSLNCHPGRGSIHNQYTISGADSRYSRRGDSVCGLGVGGDNRGVRTFCFMQYVCGERCGKSTKNIYGAIFTQSSFG